MAHMRNVLSSLLGRKGEQGPCLKLRSRTIVKPEGPNVQKRLHMAYLVLLVGLVLSGPVAALAQTSGTTPVFNATVQGESANTVEGTFANVVNYIGNVICPLGAGLGVVGTIIQAKNGKSWLPPAITTGALLGVSGVTRLIESMVQNGQSAVR
jgi:hypothetical protein